MVATAGLASGLHAELVFWFMLGSYPASQAPPRPSRDLWMATQPACRGA